MSFGKLLAAGKSFVNGRAMVAYRENKHFYLPKFGSPKNPFTIPAKTGLPTPTVENSVAPMEKVLTPALAKTQKMPVISGTPKSLATWTSRLNPMTMLRGSQPQVKDLQSPVQEELSLEKVKVVHNDLTDAEVEIVPVKSRSAAPNLQPPEKSWEVLGERIFGTNAT
jgi:malonyl CoA-acyl carrier protein transacylase